MEPSNLLKKGVEPHLLAHVHFAGQEGHLLYGIRLFIIVFTAARHGPYTDLDESGLP